ncbi:MAG: hypothetical protein AB7O24_31330 [Kofleriaceae bacterium]
MSSTLSKLTALDLSKVVGGKGASGRASSAGTVKPKVKVGVPSHPPEKENPVEEFIRRGNQFVGEGTKLLAAPLAGPSLLCPQCPAIMGEAKARSGDGTA